MCFYYNLINISIATIETSSDVRLICFSGEDDTLYVESYDCDSMISTVNKYNLSTLNKTDVYTFDFSGFQKSTEYDISSKCGNYLFIGLEQLIRNITDVICQLLWLNL